MARKVVKKGSEIPFVITKCSGRNEIIWNGLKNMRDLQKQNQTTCAVETVLCGVVGLDPAIDCVMLRLLIVPIRK